MANKIGRPKVSRAREKINFPIRFARDDVKAFEQAANKEELPVKEWVTVTLIKAAKAQ